MSSEDRASATLIFVAFTRDAFAWLHLEDVVRLDGVQSTLSLASDKFNRILRLASFIYDGDCN